MASSEALSVDETESVSTMPGVDGEIVPLPVTEEACAAETVGEEPRVVVPEGVVQAGPAASQSGGGLVTQADIRPASCSSVGKYIL